MAKVLICLRMVMCIQDNIKKVSLMDLDSTNGKTLLFMLVSLKMELSMVKASGGNE